jgi:glycosyltransferase involved in cell wall biosynthesis
LLRASRKLPQIPLHIAGDEPSRGQACEHAASAGRSHVRVLGQCDRRELLQLIKSRQHLVFPSLWYESFHMVVIEAFACGLPIVASDLGAAAEIVDHGRTSLRFRPGDAGAVSETVAWLWERPATSPQMGREAQADYETKYCEQRYYTRMLEIYVASRSQDHGRRAV